MNNVFFLITDHPHTLTIAVRTGKAGYSGAYDFIDSYYGWTDAEKIEKSDEFKYIPQRDLPSELIDDQGFQQKLKSCAISAYIHKS